MATAIQASYNHQVFNSLPYLKDAVARYEEANNPIEIIGAELGELFTKHGVEGTLSLALLHRHFEMAPDERLVEHGDMSVPWQVNDQIEDLPVKAPSGKLVGRTFKLMDGTVVPVEFGFNPSHGPAPYRPLPDAPEFYRELSAILERDGLSDIIGLATISGKYEPGYIVTERTFGGVNVMTHDNYARL
ncbi:hypothetical protein MKZ38_005238 [Zalerion maritima]|uniref:Uncharacterized protein n=1 Tax=Zalerion maritima TaxID=339359 RepID=A0AAD5RKF6_9PEZI|nr:hypothetical protein MKZ38_005238 [Zalerion maritima]